MHEDRIVRARHLRFIDDPLAAIFCSCGNVLIGVAVKKLRAPALSVNYVRACKSFVDIICDCETSAGRVCQSRRSLHQFFVEIVTFGMRDDEIMAHLCCCERKTIRHRHWKRLGVPGPREYHALPSHAELFTNRQHIRERLAGMMDRRLEIEDGDGCITRESVEYRICPLFLPVFQGRKSSHANRRTISFEHTDKFGYVLGLVRVHHCPGAMFECPTRSAGFQHDRVSTKLVYPHLHRRARPQTGIKKHKRYRLSRQRLRNIIATLETQGRIEQTSHLLARHPNRVQQISVHPRQKKTHPPALPSNTTAATIS